MIARLNSGAGASAGWLAHANLNNRAGGAVPDSFLVIRNAQLQVFAEEKEGQWVIDYLAGSYPEIARAMGMAALRNLVKTAQAKARSHGFHEPQMVRKYAHAAFLLGADFESNPQMGWARQILSSPRYKDPLSRLRALEDATVRYLEQASSKANGPESR